MRVLIWIAAGGSLGAVARFLMARTVYRFTGAYFPWGTLAVNVLGCFIIGFLFELFERTALSPEVKSFCTIGFLGAFTTFSTYSLETINLFRDGEFRLGAMNVALSNIVGIVAAVLGIMIARILLKYYK
ncbi:MAG TPA: fluoride efflux transporter CrcB [Spirochaetota bacterium]|nr:fluoride efflux transporter CrcB [Spirochaetota bacterium]HSA13968.1 fluoride efflux transporter CrcB [Spirochaetota bacterium]